LNDRDTDQQRTPRPAADSSPVVRHLPVRATTKLELNVEFKLQDETLESGELRLVQALVAPGSRLVGHTLKDLDFRNRYKGLVLAVQRRGEAIRDKLNAIELGLGDALLIQAPEAQIERLRRDENFIVLDEVEDAGMRRHKVPLVLGIITAVVGLAALNIMPILVTALLGCLALVLTGCLDLEEAYAAIDWKVIFLLAGILPLGIAMQNSGAAPWIAESAVGRVGGLGPVAVLAVFYLLTSILTEAMSNNAAAVLLAPIAHIHGTPTRHRSAAAADGHHFRGVHRLLDAGRVPDEHHDLQPRWLQVYRLPAHRRAAKHHLLDPLGDLHPALLELLDRSYVRPPLEYQTE
jgi:hypothetical protein